ncbi:MAG: hypothetical protein ACE5JP_10730 [Candidatus Bipolaricaulia bacterium]
MYHPYLTMRLGQARMEELHREAERARLVRAAQPPSLRPPQFRARVRIRRLVNLLVAFLPQPETQLVSLDEDDEIANCTREAT